VIGQDVIIRVRGLFLFPRKMQDEQTFNFDQRDLGVA
jgi:hypothetical protein